eukprot:gene9127-10703_t
MNNNFEPSSQGVFVPGLVKPILSPNINGVKVPELVDPSPTYQKNIDAKLISPQLFQYFFASDTNTNIPMELDLDFASSVINGETVYTFHDESFFPIDGQGFDNATLVGYVDQKWADINGTIRNFHFCLSINSAFTMRKGLTFNLTVDDDVWMFINSQLIIDLGGIHDLVDASVDLDAIIPPLTIGTTYPFDFFYCERKAPGSNLKIQTNILQMCEPNAIDYCGPISNLCITRRCPAANTPGVIPEGAGSNLGSKCSYSMAGEDITDKCIIATCNITTGVVVYNPLPLLEINCQQQVCNNATGISQLPSKCDSSRPCEETSETVTLIQAGYQAFQLSIARSAIRTMNLSMANVSVQVVHLALVVVHVFHPLVNVRIHVSIDPDFSVLVDNDNAKSIENSICPADEKFWTIGKLAGIIVAIVVLVGIIVITSVYLRKPFQYKIRIILDERKALVGQTLHVTHDGGVKKQLFKAGQGVDMPKLCGVSCLIVHYVGKTIDGTVFENTHHLPQFKQQLGKMVVLGSSSDDGVPEGLMMAIKTMKRQERASVTLRSKYAFGSAGVYGKILPNVTCVYDIELVAFSAIEDLSVKRDGSVSKRVIVAGNGEQRTRLESSIIMSYTLTDVATNKVLEQKKDQAYTVGDGDKVLADLDIVVLSMTAGERSMVTLGAKAGKDKKSLDITLIKSTQPEMFTADSRLTKATERKVKAGKLFSAKCYAEAIRWYQRAADLCELGTGEEDKAACQVLRVQCMVNQGVCRLLMTEYKATIQICTAVIGEDTNHIKAHYLRGKAYRELFEFEASRADFTTILAIDPTNADTLKEMDILKRREAEELSKEKIIYSKSMESFQTPTVRP